MKQFVLAWDMRKAFTLIEVMVAVVIISIVIMALLEMRGHTTHIFSRLSEKSEINQHLSFLVSNKEYGFKNTSITLDKLLDDFDMDNELRHHLQAIKVDLVYQEIDSIELAENDDENLSSTMVFEIGKTILKTEKSSTALTRIILR